MLPLSWAAYFKSDTPSRDLQPPCLLCLQALKYLHTLQTCQGLLPGELGAQELFVREHFTKNQQGLQELSTAMRHATR